MVSSSLIFSAMQFLLTIYLKHPIGHQLRPVYLWSKLHFLLFVTFFYFLFFCNSVINVVGQKRQNMLLLKEQKMCYCERAVTNDMLCCLNLRTCGCEVSSLLCHARRCCLDAMQVLHHT